MSGAVIYCRSCRDNHRLGQRDVEDAINSLSALLATEQTDGDVFTNPADTDDVDERLDYFCVLDDLSSWRDGEMLAEHLEATRGQRLDKQAQHG